jgi:hypothetical protein
MSKIDFKILVEQILLEDIKTFLNKVSSKVPELSEGALKAFYDMLNSPDRYISGERLEPYLELTPVFNAIIMTLGGTYDKAREVIIDLKKNNINNVDSFYGVVNTKITDDILKYIVPLVNFDFNQKYASGNVKDTYFKARKLRTKQALIQNVWPTLQPLTIYNALIKIFDVRLIGLEKVKISMQILLGAAGGQTLQNITQFKSYAQTFLDDLFVNFEEYSSGSKKIEPNFVKVLENINITYEDLITIATYTQELYVFLINSYIDSFSQNISAEVKERTLEASLKNIKRNTILLAKYGSFNHTLPITDISISPQEVTEPIKYTLDQIEKLNNESGNEIINKIKQISTGIREKDSEFQKLITQRLGYAQQAASAIAGFGGAKLYG